MGYYNENSDQEEGYGIDARREVQFDDDSHDRNEY